MGDCVFCDVDRLPKDRETRRLGFADFHIFEPLNPVVPGHLLVVPERHVPDAAANPAVAGLTMETAALVAQRYDSANIITSIGAAATQSVYHLHLHVVPRVEGDGLTLPWTAQQRQASTDWAQEQRDALRIAEGPPKGITLLSGISIRKEDLEIWQPRLIDVVNAEREQAMREEVFKPVPINKDSC